jgi:hypothetical protein
MEYVIGELKVNGARVPSLRDVGELRNYAKLRENPTTSRSLPPTKIEQHRRTLSNAERAIGIRLVYRISV